MTRLTISISESEEELIEAKVGEGAEYESKSAFVRECMQRYEHSRQLEARVDDLQRQLREANRQNEDVEELANYIEREKQLQIDEREKRNAPLLKRIEWLLFGFNR
jgi:Arc/MetJ-type ribon-helix-helix transcriptional regulator